jgi:hypothetical protein
MNGKIEIISFVERFQFHPALAVNFEVNNRRSRYEAELAEYMVIVTLHLSAWTFVILYITIFFSYAAAPCKTKLRILFHFRSVDDALSQSDRCFCYIGEKDCNIQDYERPG